MPRVEVLLIGLPHKMFWQQGVADDVSGQRKEIHVSVGISCDEGDSWLIFELVWHQILRSDRPHVVMVAKRGIVEDASKESVW